MTVLNRENILTVLKEKGYDAKIQEETGQVYSIFTEEKQEFPLFARIYENGDLLQLIAFFPFQLESKIFPEMARLLHLLNKELDVPGFGMDELGGVCFFRCMINAPHKKLDKDLLELYLNSVRLACKTFIGTIAAVASGSMTVDELLEKAQKSVKEMKK